MAKPKQASPNYRSGSPTSKPKNYGTMPQIQKAAYGNKPYKSVGQNPYPNGTSKK